MGSEPPVPPIPPPGKPAPPKPQPCATEQPVEETADVAVPDATQDMPDENTEL